MKLITLLIISMILPASFSYAQYSSGSTYNSQSIPKGPQDQSTKPDPKTSQLDQDELEQRQDFLMRNQERIDRESKAVPKRTSTDTLQVMPDGRSWE